MAGASNLRDNSMMRERLACELSMQPKTARIPHMASLSLDRSIAEEEGGGGGRRRKKVATEAAELDEFGFSFSYINGGFDQGR